MTSRFQIVSMKVELEHCSRSMVNVDMLVCDNILNVEMLVCDNMFNVNSLGKY